MQSVVDRLFAGVTPQDFGGDVHFMCTADVAPPKQFEGQWSSIIPGSESQQPTWLGEHQLLKISAIVAIANVTDDRQQQAITAMGSYLHQHALIAPPVILIPVSDNSMVLAQKTVWPFVQHLLSQAIIDDLIWGMPIGFAFAFAVQAKMRSITAMLHQVQHDLCRRAARAESMYRMNDSIDFALWHYMGSRLLHNIPPVLEDVDEPNGHVAGFRIGGKLCKGVFGMVYKASRAAMPASDTQHHSMLVIDKQAERHTLLDLKMINRFLFVMETLNTVRHPNISQLISVFHLPKRLYVCMDVGGRRTLYSRLRCRDAPKDDAQPRPLPSASLMQIVVQVCAAVIHIHQVHRICHRDLKPENFTISDESKDGDLNVKLSGFDLALVQGIDAKCKSPCGTMPFAAPETFLAGSVGYDGMSADMWSLGILLLEVACGIRVVERLITKKSAIERFEVEPMGSGDPPSPEFWRNICNIFREEGVFTELLGGAVPEAQELMGWLNPLVRGLLVEGPEGRLNAASLQTALPTF
mmetsp:Transcript_171664/g.550242  ORF Transcript_171664/g.550242 Transcript_171664/m.550242 type:complete len:524 (-) Transcript_171664:45-1616(-)|eukprot:CAMPEP_0203939290 /NCGR_PEP_ID=MMETSP0359-20131031/76117_1 /ASSEMBLY_ACC=CAM_ASM_000338 /TAXON_ID=268821 /ORGANISM="Scrippsiella Hangoei, Strain SHTV-5" /LENGTH=523 /DNA_ID=CAMNT_0050869595 /DNA_START=48 /DNA_END=1619 /DNA_ORIENTATION=-